MRISRLRRTVRTTREDRVASYRKEIMPWPIDQTKLDRVRALMKDQDLAALVVRAPDNVLYLTNYWCMKGYDAVVFPREGEPTLIALEPQLADAQRNSWTRDGTQHGYAECGPHGW
jgi:Xaa-Pro aminopeptidase